jgi:hypothetical protein
MYIFDPENREELLETVVDVVWLFLVLGIFRQALLLHTWLSLLPLGIGGFALYFAALRVWAWWLWWTDDSDDDDDGDGTPLVFHTV